MKIVKILGGIGNQMFQYALYLALKQKFGDEKVLVDYSYFKTYNVHNGLELKRVFDVELPQASFLELLKVTRPVYSFKLSRVIRKIFLARKTECLEAADYTYNELVFSEGNKYYDGYWQNYKYFIEYKDEILEAFRFKMPINEQSKLLAEELKNKSNAISLHVRRGDYLKAKNYAGLCGLEYYKKAITHILANTQSPSFYIFSDDIEWCKENISPLLGNNEYKYIDFNRGCDSPLDMMLMSLCHHNIIANSSFSWWGAFLNNHNDKIVCAPEKWTNTKVNCKFQMPEWILF